MWQKAQFLGVEALLSKSSTVGKQLKQIVVCNTKAYYFRIIVLGQVYLTETVTFILVAQ